MNLSDAKEMRRHYTIPIFIPEKACPYRCIYCNQYRISDRLRMPHPDEIRETIKTYLATFIPGSIKNIGFFGGSFTGMSIEEQNQYLDIAASYVECGEVDAIQLSTRPDYISEDILKNLKEHRVRIIELGAQSLHEEVLTISRRGHTVDEVKKAAGLILDHGFQLGLQMMIGLPGDTFERSLETAREIISLGAHYTRIYPTVVIKDTFLEELYRSGEYQPLSLNDAIAWTKELMLLFEKNNVSLLRVGLHPSEGLISGENWVAGPFHISFKELVLTAIWNDILKDKTREKNGAAIEIWISPKQLNPAIGHKASNKRELLTRFKKVYFYPDPTLAGFEVKVNIC